MDFQKFLFHHYYCYHTALFILPFFECLFTPFPFGLLLPSVRPLAAPRLWWQSWQLRAWIFWWLISLIDESLAHSKSSVASNCGYLSQSQQLTWPALTSRKEWDLLDTTCTNFLASHASAFSNAMEVMILFSWWDRASTCRLDLIQEPSQGSAFLKMHLFFLSADSVS